MLNLKGTKLLISNTYMYISNINYLFQLQAFEDITHDYKKYYTLYNRSSGMWFFLYSYNKEICQRIKYYKPIAWKVSIELNYN